MISEALQIAVPAFTIAAAFVIASQPGEILAFIPTKLPKWYWLMKLIGCTKCLATWIAFFIVCLFGFRRGEFTQDSPLIYLSGISMALLFGWLFERIKDRI